MMINDDRLKFKFFKYFIQGVATVAVKVLLSLQRLVVIIEDTRGKRAAFGNSHVIWKSRSYTQPRSQGLCCGTLGRIEGPGKGWLSQDQIFQYSWKIWSCDNQPLPGPLSTTCFTTKRPWERGWSYTDLSIEKICVFLN